MARGANQRKLTRLIEGDFDVPARFRGSITDRVTATDLKLMADMMDRDYSRPYKSKLP